MTAETIIALRRESDRRMGLDNYTLLTGATGLLGQFLLRELLRSRLPTAVLVRPAERADAVARIEPLLQRFERLGARRFVRPVVLAGDLRSEQLGLSAADREWVKRRCGRVLHSAANLSFRPADQHPENEPFTTNVDGTRRLLQMCEQLGIGEFHHISSAYVCGQRTGVILEDEGPLGQSFSNDYEASKLQAEGMLRSAVELSSLTVYRPSIVIDPLPGSQLLGDRTLYYAFSLYRAAVERFGLPDPGDWLAELGLSGRERKNIVTADWAARIIVQILRRPRWHGATYHLTSPTGTSSATLEAAFRQVMQEQGAPPRPRQAAARSAASSGIAAQFLETFAPYMRDDPKFDQTTLLRVLTGTGEANCPEAGVAEICTLARQQLSPPRGASESPQIPTADWPGFAKSLIGDAALKGAEAIANLALTGAGGGEWTLAATASGRIGLRRGADPAAGVWLYATCQSWEKLLRQESSLASLLAAGEALLEAAEDTPVETSACGLMERLIAGLHTALRPRAAGREARLHAN